MKDEILTARCSEYLRILCIDIPERSVGSEGNRTATHFFELELKSKGWVTAKEAFDAIDWKDGGATLSAHGQEFSVFVSPYSNGYCGEAELVSASTIEDIEKLEANHKFILLQGEISCEQLMPKNFVFYNPEEHQKIIALLEKSGAKALICATGRNAALAGGVYPFPLIEDGDFEIPSVYMTEEEGQRLLRFCGDRFFLESRSERIPGVGYNVTGRKGNINGRRIVITAHIDAKKGTPGAIDNATGIIVLMLLAELLRDYSGERLIEIVAFNGEDYYAVPGQMQFIEANQGKFGEIILNINIDGAGYHEGRSAISFYDLAADTETTVRRIIEEFPGITTGPQWPQGDHSIFVQSGVPAIAVSSEWFTENIATQEITHTPKDNPAIVDVTKIPEIARFITEIIKRI